jgi:carbon-monoxide dehydrogenase large subunit
MRVLAAFSTEDPMTQAPPKLNPRVDAPAKVSGSARYAADITRPGLPIGAVLRSPVPHAEIVRIDTAAAKALPGVRAVLTAADLPDVRMGRTLRDMPVLARDRVRFIGEKVAAVAADSAEIAEEAIGRIHVEYRELPAVFDPIEAILPDAPPIHDPALIRAWSVPRQIVPDHPNGVTQLAWGAAPDEVEAALAAADRIVEHTFHTRQQHQVYIEPHTCLVDVAEDGMVDIWASNKAPFLLATYLEQGLGLRAETLRMHLLPLGGDFGGKGSFMDVPLAYFLSRASGRPVRMRMRFTDELTAGNPRHAAAVNVRSGVMRDGRIVARLVRSWFNSGAYAAFKPSPDVGLPNIRVGSTGPYDIPVLRVETEMVYTNSVPAGHMRNPGEAQTTYALECHTELLARELQLDPVELRRTNATVEPRRGEAGEDIAPRIGELLDRAVAAIGWNEPAPAGIGRGLALAELGTSPGVYSGAMEIAPDGRVTFETPMIENGAGMLTAFRRLVADELGVPAELVTVAQSSSRFDVDRGVGGSRVTRLTAIVVQRLAEELRAQVAAALGATRDGQRFSCPDGAQLSLAEAAGRLKEPLPVQVTYEATARDNITVHSVQAVEVQVDSATGEVRPLRVVSVHEAGRIINQQTFDGQIEGALIQGLGYALMEGLIVEEGRVTNVNLHEYKVPTVADVPPLTVIILPPDERLGITPIGEGGVGMAPAVAHAISDALGGSVAFDLPITAEAVTQQGNTRR